KTEWKRAATTASSLEAKQDNGNINRTQSMETLNESLPQGTGSGSGPRRIKEKQEKSQDQERSQEVKKRSLASRY
ncbi:hypothetical protein Tco_1415274, partial [Tanacetum coccineum]